MLITHCRLREARSPGSENIAAARAHSCLLFIIALPVVIKPPGYYYPFRALQQDTHKAGWTDPQGSGVSAEQIKDFNTSTILQTNSLKVKCVGFSCCLSQQTCQKKENSHPFFFYAFCKHLHFSLEAAEATQLSKLWLRQPQICVSLKQYTADLGAEREERKRKKEHQFIMMQLGHCKLYEAVYSSSLPPPPPTPSLAVLPLIKTAAELHSLRCNFEQNGCKIRLSFLRKGRCYLPSEPKVKN